MVGFWQILLSVLALLASIFLGADMIGFDRVLAATKTVQLSCKGWRSSASKGYGDEQGGNESDVVSVVEKMREFGHYKLSMSDCVDAEHWFLRAREMLERGDANSSMAVAVNWSQPEELEHAALLGDHGFALICASRFTDGIAILKPALRNHALPAAQPHLLNALGFALFQLREYDDAAEAFQAAV